MWRYFSPPKYRKLRRRLVLGELAWLGFVIALAFVNLPATFVVFVLPLVIMRILMMSGNFTQHAFVDVDDPGNPYRNSTCLINTPYNHRCYNDGYHIVHHIKANLHWSEMAQWYDDNREEFARQDAIVFDGVNSNQQLFFWLMSKNYDRMAEHVVNFRGRTHEQLVELLKSRTRRRMGEIEWWSELRQAA
ncbi:MAG: fatty acid desaturase [Myxococcota bacterium]